jgi:hypothetical protein
MPKCIEIFAIDSIDSIDEDIDKIYVMVAQPPARIHP